MGAAAMSMLRLKHTGVVFGWVTLCVFTLLVSEPARAERIKDLAKIAGVRSNQLIGYGLVVGLDDTGDSVTQTKFTVQSLKSLLRNFDINLPPNVDPRTANIAAVMVTATLPPFARPGHTIDVTVASMGDADSLRGGTLLMTPLKGADGAVYAIAQGSVAVSGVGAEGDGASVTVGVPSSGRIPNGATVERIVPTPFTDDRFLTLQLNRPDFTTAKRMIETINAIVGGGVAEAEDGGTVRVAAPLSPSARVGFVSLIENLTLDPGDGPARVVVNSRTGTVVIGRHVRVLPAAVSHGNLVVTIQESPEVSQPAPFSRRGDTVVVPRTEIDVTEDGNPMFLFQPGVTLDEIVRAVNEVGATPADLIAIMQALDTAGALRGELVVM